MKDYSETELKAQVLKAQVAMLQQCANNNVMRHEYRVLTDEEKLQMKEIKDKGLDFVNYINASGRKSREMSLAITKIEEAVMWAVKDITK